MLAFVLLFDDRSACIEVAMFADTFSEYRDSWSRMHPGGRRPASFDDYSGAPATRGKTVRTLLEARSQHVRGLELQLEDDFRDFAGELRRLLDGGGGSCLLLIRYRRRGAQVRPRLPEQWKVQPSDELLQRLRDRLRYAGANELLGPARAWQRMARSTRWAESRIL